MIMGLETISELSAARLKLLAVLVVAFVLLGIAGWQQLPPRPATITTITASTPTISSTTQTTPIKSEGFTEIIEYEGKKLSSIKDFRENSIRGPQMVDISRYQLSITGLVKNPGNLTYDEALRNYQSQKKVMTMHCVEGWSVTLLWEGVPLKDLMKEAIPLSNAKVVIFHSVDGYTTSLPLDYVINNGTMLAYKMNGIVLPPERGFPFELTAEEKWGYKWIKWVSEIELSDDVNYRGYWESRGYSNDGDIDKPFFEA
jgi:DMSO/TMAO reductase YedYZ molybdopterin-dependent catalytic subunit